MKKYLFYLLFISFFFFNVIGCSEDNIMLYNNKDYILFTRYIQDSVSFSFLSYPNTDEAECKLEVKLIGKPSDKEREYKISVMKDYTDAPETSYILPQKFIMKAGQVVDSFTIVLKKTAELSSVARRLTLCLEESEDFALGQTERLVNIINISNIIFKPEWWNTTIVRTWLGEYSDEKYELFIKVNNGKVDVDINDTNEIRTCTLKLKNYLKQMKEKGQTVYEKDGKEMTVAYIGG